MTEGAHAMLERPDQVGAPRLLDVVAPIPPLARTFFQRPDRLADPLYVVCVVYNPVRFRSRWRLLQDFEKRCSEAGAVLYTVEAAFGQRSFSVTDTTNPRHIQVRTPYELWLKENLINVGISRLPADWRYVAWIDADVAFARDDWANETLHALQHHPVVQMWTEGADLAPDHTTFRTFRSFAWCYERMTPDTFPKGYYYGARKGAKEVVTWHPGYAWAARREAIDHLGGLIDWAIVGSADRHMAAAFIGRAAETVQHKNVGKAYRQLVMELQGRAERYIRRDLGYVEGLVLHHWHGKKEDLMRFVRLVEVNEYGSIYYTLDGKRVDPKDNAEIWVRWPDETTQCCTIRLKAVIEKVSEPGSTEEVPTKRAYIIADHHGKPMWVPIAQVDVDADALA